ncbi:conserved hypothetical protein [Theileria equi strain WA]|uniref:Protein ARV n=1 Tax=Theileria equi strain WA TaxID=1537102 RepID=L1LCQ3_THEEQ|nr:conserved hypothetical protein [Theileria equi strain WA]EKX72943.1 conserved hypothetical protein [Theileria equi strain WA]|eukprot:XP_004832395.1 conserved hypothetical protein [Theileria equi strain WA]
MVVCVHCGLKVQTLYHIYGRKSYCLATCTHCGEIADKYVEWELPIVIIGLFLFKIDIYRHLVYNRSSRPFQNDATLSHNRRATILKLMLLSLSVVLLDSFSIITSCAYVTQKCTLCDKSTKLKDQRMMEELLSYFTDASVPYTKEHFIHDDIETSLKRESTLSISSLLSNMARIMFHYSKLNLIERHETTNECSSHINDNRIGKLYLILLQNPTLYNWIKYGIKDCQYISEVEIMTLSICRLLGYYIFISISSIMVSKCRRVKHRKAKGHKHIPDDNESSIINVTFALLLSFHIKALVLMMNIWRPRITILIVIELYIYLSNAIGLRATCNISNITALMMVFFGTIFKLCIYFIWSKVCKMYF